MNVKKYDQGEQRETLHTHEAYYEFYPGHSYSTSEKKVLGFTVINLPTFTNLMQEMARHS